MGRNHAHRTAKSSRPYRQAQNSSVLSSSVGPTGRVSPAYQQPNRRTCRAAPIVCCQLWGVNIVTQRFDASRVPSAAPFTAAQARAAGCSRATIRYALRTGRWVPLRRGVYVEASHLAAVAESAAKLHALDVAALLLVIDRDAVAGATSAARIFGMDQLGRPGPEPVLLTSAAAIKGAHRSGYRLRSTVLPAHHRTTGHGVPITSAARTVVDLARTRSFTEGVVVADSALRKGLVTLEQLSGMIEDCSTWRGITRARRVVQLTDPLAESVLESLSRAAIYQQNLPAPRTQVPLGDAFGRRCRVDFLWEDLRVVGEADGLDKYETSGERTTREVVRAEKRREEWLADAGFEVVRWGWEDANDPPRLAHRLRAAFARSAERRLGRQIGRQLGPQSGGQVRPQLGPQPGGQLGPQREPQPGRRTGPQAAPQPGRRHRDAA